MLIYLHRQESDRRRRDVRLYLAGQSVSWLASIELGPVWFSLDAATGIQVDLAEYADRCWKFRSQQDVFEASLVRFQTVFFCCDRC